MRVICASTAVPLPTLVSLTVQTRACRGPVFDEIVAFNEVVAAIGVKFAVMEAGPDATNV